MQEKFKVGYYIKPFGNSFIEINLERILKNISGENFKTIITTAREIYNSGNSEEYTLYKNKLPAVTFSGTFSPARNASSIVSYSSLIVLDIDKIGERLQKIKHDLFKDMFVVAIWLSPSGDGLKFLISTSCSRDLHKQVYKNAVKYFTTEYGVEIDKSGSDVSRLCFISYDPELLFRTDFLNFDDDTTENSKSQNSDSVASQKIISKSISITKSAIINNEGQKKILKKIYHYLKKRGLSITGTYEEWVRVGFALSNTFSKDIGRRYFLDFCRLDGARHDERSSERLIENCYQHGTSSSSFNTIIYLAQLQGYVINFNKPKHSKLI
ncbi:hypothetical protein ASU31_10635 [Pedobacter ginsenosidimutans]|uniref:BT4734-like N-terminal domain-containing protein n=1 Tax=Pedobacter ginsenosidimutans TaxID=687842 RepID=A0A0T5VQX4_9SPHI|nr:BT4734/BF3469 family protein [Pedobacter ginsenosidimutans]KRT15956.1 hypothetical protein ASU31_10635 [Pedobacter ginsenosidimutans]